MPPSLKYADLLDYASIPYTFHSSLAQPIVFYQSYSILSKLCYRLSDLINSVSFSFIFEQNSAWDFAVL